MKTIRYVFIPFASITFMMVWSLEVLVGYPLKPMKAGVAAFTLAV
jgi:hypothetical protein